MKLICILLVCFVCLPLFLVSGVQADAGEFPKVYFSETDDSGVPQMRVLTAPGRAEDVFLTNNDGYVESLSPDGSHLAFIRYQWDIPPLESQAQIWVAYLRTSQQWPVGSQVKAAGGLWSPDSQHFLIHELEAIAPLWTGYNYGRLSIYSLVDNSLTRLENIRAFSLGWYPTSQNLLLWNEVEGYFTYSLLTKSIHLIQFQPPISGVYRGGDTLSSAESAITALSVDNLLLVYSLSSGELLQSITPNTSGSILRPYWSPDGRYLVIELTNDDVLIWDYQSNELLNRVSNLLDESPLGYLHRVYWTTSPQRLFVVAWVSSGVAIYEIDVFSGEVTIVYQTR